MNIRQQSQGFLTIYVRMQIKLDYGLALYILGDIEQLGKWSIQKGLRLLWTEGDNWRGSFTIPMNSVVNYKYAIAQFDNPQESSCVWENGSNRLLVHQDPNNHELCLNERWNQQRVTLQVLTSAQQEPQEILVLGNCVELGLWTSPRRMIRKKTIKCPNFQIKELWSLTFFAEKQKEFIQYQYIQKTVRGTQTKEREPNHFIYLNLDRQPSSNRPNRLETLYSPGQIRVVELDTFDHFEISQITQQLSVGSYPRNEKDVVKLRNNRVKAVLSLQSKRDLKAFNIDIDRLHQLYRKHDIAPFNLEILDMKIQDFVKKSAQAVELLRQIVKNYGSVYVHCTAGIYRSPQLIAIYLILFQSYSIQNAINLVKSKRSVAQPNLRCIQMSVLKSMQDDQEQQCLKDILSYSRQQKNNIEQRQLEKHMSCIN